MIYFILRRDQVSEAMLNSCAPWVLTARGDSTGEYVAIRFTEDPDIIGGMTLDLCKAVMMADPNRWACEENDFNEDPG